MASPRIIITGAAGFIGFHLASRLLDEGLEVVGIDNFNPYYSVQLKRDRHARLEGRAGYCGHKMDLCDLSRLRKIFSAFRPTCVINLAAQPGVRHSLKDPFVYQRSNIEGFLNILECCRHAQPQPRLIYASSSSVYGANTQQPFSEEQCTETPLSLYAATKKANELMAHSYSNLFGLQTIGLRFFTVYGPWSRPDMATWLFAEAMLADRPIRVFNHGEMRRDFTYVDDIVSGVVGCVHAKELPRNGIYNIGNNHSERLLDMIRILARELGVANPRLDLLPMEPGDMMSTCASVDRLNAAVGYQPTTPIEVGLPKFAAWFRAHHARYQS